ncbi:hypothetical protein C8J57DRAFT_1246075 [Mycena rebaudengoi]|nr:hypothetical protein C8J57DRAFT_1246075 [Mycena rebaudengoi]
MGIFELQKFSTFLRRGKFVSDMGTHGIGGATYLLLRKRKKRLVSRVHAVEDAGRLTSCCASVKKASGERRATYPLLREREKAVVSSAHAVEKAGRLTRCCASVKKRGVSNAHQQRRRRTYPLLRERKKRGVSSARGMEKAGGFTSCCTSVKNTSSAARARWRKQDYLHSVAVFGVEKAGRLAICCASMKNTSARGVENAGPLAICCRVRRGARRTTCHLRREREKHVVSSTCGAENTGRLTLCCAGGKTRCQQGPRSGERRATYLLLCEREKGVVSSTRGVEKAGRITSCWASVKNASSAARAVWRKQGCLQPVARTRKTCHQQGARSEEHRMTYILSCCVGMKNTERRAENTGRLTPYCAGVKKNVVSSAHGVEKAGRLTACCAGVKKHVVSSAHGVEKAGRLTHYCQRTWGGESRRTYPLLREREEHVLVRSEESRRTYSLLRGREKHVVSSVVSSARGVEKAGRLTSCCASVKNASSAARAGWREQEDLPAVAQARRTHHQQRARSGHSRTTCHLLRKPRAEWKKQDDLPSVARGREKHVVSSAQSGESRRTYPLLSGRENASARAMEKAGQLTACCANVGNTSSAARAEWRKQDNLPSVTRRREKGVVSSTRGVENAGRLTSCCVGAKNTSSAGVQSEQSRTTYILLCGRSHVVSRARAVEKAGRLTFCCTGMKNTSSAAHTEWRMQDDLPSIARRGVHAVENAGRLTSCCASLKNASSAAHAGWRKQEDLPAVARCVRSGESRTTCHLLGEREKHVISSACGVEKAGQLTACCGSVRNASSGAHVHNTRSGESRTTHILLCGREKHVVSSAHRVVKTGRLTACCTSVKTRCQQRARSGESRTTCHLLCEREKHVVSSVCRVEKAGQLTACCASVRNASSAARAERRKQENLPSVTRRREKGVFSSAVKAGLLTSCCAGVKNTSSAARAEWSKQDNLQPVVRAKEKRRQRRSRSGERRATYILLLERQQTHAEWRKQDNLQPVVRAKETRRQRRSRSGERRATYILLLERQQSIRMRSGESRTTYSLLCERKQCVVSSACGVENAGRLTVYCASVKKISAFATSSAVPNPNAFLYAGPNIYPRHRVSTSIPPNTCQLTSPIVISVSQMLQYKGDDLGVPHQRSNMKWGSKPFPYSPISSHFNSHICQLTCEFGLCSFLNQLVKWAIASHGNTSPSRESLSPSRESSIYGLINGRI